MDRDVLIAIFAHPDDESLLAGGILAAAASAPDISVVIVSMTRGELGAPALSAAVRPSELALAGSKLGARSAYCLDLPDAGLEADLTATAGAVAELCATLEPAAVLTFAADGWYWHSDHMAVHYAVMDMLPKASPATSVYVTSWPRHRMTRLTRATRARGAPAELWGLDPAAFGDAHGAFDYVLDVTPFLPVKMGAIAAHASQTARGSLFASLPADVAQRYLAFEFLTIARQGRFDVAERLRAVGVGVRDRRRSRSQTLERGGVAA